eukprot:3296885-Pleurochrysis_carterae.AAC.1
MYVRKDDTEGIFKALQPWQRELIARRWLKQNEYFWADVRLIQNCWYNHFLATCRQPAGRADGSRGSQQCCFEMEIHHKDAVHCLGLGCPTVFELKSKQKYSIGTDGQVQWLPTNSIDTLYLSDKKKFSNYLSFETREVAKGVA